MRLSFSPTDKENLHFTTTDRRYSHQITPTASLQMLKIGAISALLEKQDEINRMRSQCLDSSGIIEQLEQMSAVVARLQEENKELKEDYAIVFRQLEAAKVEHFAIIEEKQEHIERLLDTIQNTRENNEERRKDLLMRISLLEEQKLIQSMQCREHLEQIFLLQTTGERGQVKSETQCEKNLEETTFREEECLEVPQSPFQYSLINCCEAMPQLVSDRKYRNAQRDNEIDSMQVSSLRIRTKTSLKSSIKEIEGVGSRPVESLFLSNEGDMELNYDAESQFTSKYFKYQFRVTTGELEEVDEEVRDPIQTTTKWSASTFIKGALSGATFALIIFKLFK